MSKQDRKKGAANARGSSSVIRQFDPTDLQAIGILAVLAAVFFHKILLGQAYFWEDFIYQNYPFRSFAATSLAMGQLPLWNPYTFNGMPFLADIQTTVLYVPSLLLTLFVSNGTLSYYWLQVMIILHFLLAGVGMFYLAKSFKLNNLPALFAGAAYMLSGYMIVHAIHQQNVTLVAWYPLVLLLFRRALEGKLAYVFLCGLVLGHSILAGYPQLSLYLYMFLGAWFLVELLTRFKGKELLTPSALGMTGRAAGVVIISVALAMVQLLPTLELSDLSQRARITLEKASEGSLAWSQILTLLFPKMFGTAGAAGFQYFGPGQYFYYWETCIYLGLLPLVLALLSIWLVRRDKHIWLLLGTSAFSLLFALGENFFLFKIFYEFVPGFSKFRIPARMGIFLTFSTSLLSAFSLQALLYEQLHAKRQQILRNLILAAGAAGIVLAGLVLSGTFAGSLTAAQFAQVAAEVKSSTLSAVFILLVVVTLLFALIRQKLGRFAGIMLVGVFFVDMYIFGGEQNNGRMNPGDYFRQRADLVEFFRKDGANELFRVNSRNARGLLPGWDRNQGMVDRIFTMEGYTPLALARAYAPFASNDHSFDLLNVKYKTVFDEQSGQQRLVEHTTRMPRAFVLYNIHVPLSEQELLDYLKSPDFNHRTTAVLEAEPERRITPPAATPEWRARITNYTNNEIIIDASTSHDGILVLSEIFYPGWKAYVNGTETAVHRANYNLRSLILPAGQHTVVVRFESPPFRTGFWISLTTLLLCAGGMALSMRYSRKPQETSQSVSQAA